MTKIPLYCPGSNYLTLSDLITIVVRRCHGNHLAISWSFVCPLLSANFFKENKINNRRRVLQCYVKRDTLGQMFLKVDSNIITSVRSLRCFESWVWSDGCCFCPAACSNRLICHVWCACVEHTGCTCKYNIWSRLLDFEKLGGKKMSYCWRTYSLPTCTWCSQIPRTCTVSVKIKHFRPRDISPTRVNVRPIAVYRRTQRSSLQLGLRVGGHLALTDFRQE